jgi:hypothetical protein
VLIKIAAKQVTDREENRREFFKKRKRVTNLSSGWFHAGIVGVKFIL